MGIAEFIIGRASRDPLAQPIRARRWMSRFS